MKRGIQLLLPLAMATGWLGTAQPTDLRQGLVSYWPLDELSPDWTSTPDVVSGNDMQAVSFTAGDVVPGKRGNAFQFTPDYQTYLWFKSPSVDETGLPVTEAPTWTVCVWVNATYPVPGENDRRVFSVSSSQDDNPLVNIGTHSGGQDSNVDLFVRNVGTQINHAHGTKVAYDGTWHHIALVDVGGQLDLYVDGELDSSHPYTRGPLPSDITSIGAVIRGAGGEKVAALFRGLIDDVAVWERALTQAEIQEVMNNGIATPVPPFPPYITQEPADATVNLGTRHTFSVHAIGQRPFSYQWYKDDAPIPGATGPTLTLSNLTTADSGAYRVEVSNAHGTVSSAAATLTVEPDPEPDLMAGLVNYWPLDEIRTDDSGNLLTPDLYSQADMQVVNMDASNLVPGQAGNALMFDGVEEYAFRVAGRPINNDQGFSIAMWVNAIGQGYSDLRFFAEGSSDSNTPLFTMGTVPGGPDGRLHLYIRNDAGQAVAFDSTREVLDGTWHHIVWVEANGQARLYIDGLQDETDVSYTRGTFTFNQTSLGGILRAAPSHYLPCTLDEVAAWNRPLTYTEVQLLYSQGVPEPPAVVPPQISVQPVGREVFAGSRVELSVEAIGTLPLQYQWQHNGQPIDQATDAVLVLDNVRPEDAGEYTVVVSNEGGSVVSEAATLVVTPVENLATGLVAYWPLDELGATTPDASGNGNDLTAFNLGPENLVPGPRNLAVDFSGAETFLGRRNTDGFGLPITQWPYFTVAMWVKAEGVGQADLRIFAESSSVNSTPLWTLGTSADGDHQGLNTYLRFDSGAAPLVRVFTTNPVLDNTWHHFAWVDQDGVVTVYVDGQPDPVEITHPPLVLSVDTTTLGGIWRSTPSHFFTGQLDDVALWRRPLTQAEVQQLMAEGPVSGPFRIEATTVEAGRVRLEVSVPAATGDYRLEATPTLTAPAWTEVADATVTGPTDGRLTIEFNAPAAPHQFYRVVRR